MHHDDERFINVELDILADAETDLNEELPAREKPATRVGSRVGAGRGAGRRLTDAGGPLVPSLNQDQVCTMSALSPARHGDPRR